MCVHCCSKSVTNSTSQSFWEVIMTWLLLKQLLKRIVLSKLSSYFVFARLVLFLWYFVPECVWIKDSLSFRLWFNERFSHLLVYGGQESSTGCKWKTHARKKVKKKLHTIANRLLTTQTNKETRCKYSKHKQKQFIWILLR